MTLQSLSSVLRQILAILVSVYGVLSASITQLHLPPAVSTILVAFGPLILAIEHYVGDPSTGTPTVTTTTTAPVTPPVVVTPGVTPNPVTT
jgi:hypothetical protein